MSWAVRSVQTDLRSEAPESLNSFGQCPQPKKDTPKIKTIPQPAIDGPVLFAKEPATI